MVCRSHGNRRISVADAPRIVREEDVKAEINTPGRGKKKNALTWYHAGITNEEVTPFRREIESVSRPMLVFCVLVEVLACKSGQNEAGSVDLLVVVSAQLLFLLGGPCTERFLDVAGGILATDHESNLARRIGRDGGVCVFDDGENFLTILLELGDEGKVKPLVFSWRSTSQ